MENQVATVFAEDLIQYITEKIDFNWDWKPVSSNLQFRNWYSPFSERIGDVVLQLLKSHYCDPELETLKLSRIAEADIRLVKKFFKLGYDMFNVLDYCAQLICMALMFGMEGHFGCLNYCVKAISTNIEHFAKYEGVPFVEYWNKLHEMAEKIKIRKCTSWVPNIVLLDWNKGKNFNLGFDF